VYGVRMALVSCHNTKGWHGAAQSSTAIKRFKQTQTAGKKEPDRTHNKTRINIVLAFKRWWKRRDLKCYKTDFYKTDFKTDFFQNAFNQICENVQTFKNPTWIKSGYEKKIKKYLGVW